MSGQAMSETGYLYMATVVPMPKDGQPIRDESTGLRVACYGTIREATLGILAFAEQQYIDLAEVRVKKFPIRNNLEVKDATNFLLEDGGITLLNAIRYFGMTFQRHADPETTAKVLSREEIQKLQADSNAEIEGLEPAEEILLNILARQSLKRAPVDNNAAD